MGQAFVLIVLYLLTMSLYASGIMVRVRVFDAPMMGQMRPLLQPIIQIFESLMRAFLGKPLRVLLAWFFVLGLAVLRFNEVKGVSWLPSVDTGVWGGLLLTFLLALVGIVASFPIGLLLALGRRSSLPVVKAFCVLFIEMVRGVPLVTILFLSSIILPLFLPGDVRIDRVMRAMIGMTLFAAAYMAENVRGGLQAISRGQIEAARAVGLNNFQTMSLIVLPQALRLVIPAIVGQFIALFMDTTLAVIVNLLELLGMGRSVLESKVEWKLLNMEMFLFIAAIFWIFNYAMSYASRRLEAALGVGER
jgi:general L-amino acid transport system permease protein